MLAGRNARKTGFQQLDRICDEHRKEERRQDKGYVEGGVRKSYGERERVKERSVCYSERPYPEERSRNDVKATHERMLARKECKRDRKANSNDKENNGTSQRCARRL